MNTTNEGQTFPCQTCTLDPFENMFNVLESFDSLLNTFLLVTLVLYTMTV